MKIEDLSTSPPIAAVAPISCWIFVTSLFGPAISDVPVSVIPWHPPLQNVVPLILILYHDSNIK